MNTKQTPPKGNLVAKISQLDILINKLSKIFNAVSLRNGSVMFSGKNSLHKDFHEIIVFDSTLAIPAARIKAFLGDYCQDLISQRAKLIMDLEGGENPVLQRQDPIETKTLDEAEFFCPVCVRATEHHLHQSEMGIHWQCDRCSNINTNCEID